MRNKLRSKRNTGFTLIELLIVIAIIGILASIFLVSLGKTRDQARVARAKHEMRQIINAMYLYKDKCGKFPPGKTASGDPSCQSGGEGVCADCVPPYFSCNSLQWVIVMDALVSHKLITRIDTDPWGNPYCYDDNDGIPPSSYYTPLYSMGPNGLAGTRNWFAGGPPGSSNFSSSGCNADPSIDENCDNFGFLIPDN